MIDLLRVMRHPDPPLIALVGAGGKTTWMFALAQALRSHFDTVLLTTTTHLGTWQTGYADRHLHVTGIDRLPEDSGQLLSGVVLLTGPDTPDGRVSGLNPETVARLQELAIQKRCPLLVEADGARQQPLKAPADHEPVIPDTINTVFVLAGLSGIGQVLDEAVVFRPARFSALAGVPVGERITAPAVGRMLCDPCGGLKGIPPGSRRIALLTQASSPEMKSQAGALAETLLRAYDSVLIGETGWGGEGDSPTGSSDIGPAIKSARMVTVHEPVAGVILAAGGSTRFKGQPKQLLDWNGVPMVRHVAQIALGAGLAPVLVITGAHAPAVETALEGLAVQIVPNPDWETGQSSSVRTGIRSLAGRVGGAVFLLVDQPQIPGTLIRALVETHRKTLAPVIAPLIDGERGNPVLFDWQTFADLEGLQGDIGGRGIFARHQVTWIPWHDGRMRQDIDTESDYVQLMGEMGIRPPEKDPPGKIEG